jgi:hypothetical protein
MPEVVGTAELEVVEASLTSLAERRGLARCASYGLRAAGGHHAFSEVACMAAGMAANVAHDLLFVAGGFTGQAYIYDTATDATVASYQFGTPGGSLINDVALTKDGAWFTDSLQAQLSFVPVSRAGDPAPTFRTLALSGPAATVIGNGAVNLNGIRATARGRP